jgi:hypothetical protein
MKLDLKDPWRYRRQRVNEKTEDQQYSYGCLMGYYDAPFDGSPEIADGDLFDNDENEYGREVENHVTVLYGLHDDEIDEEEIIRLFSLITTPDTFRSKVTLFENKDYDVVKWDIESNDLELLNRMMTSMFPYTNKFPDYHAHATLAYCKPGTGKKYMMQLDKPTKDKIAHWVYSKADGRKIKITPGLEDPVEVLREADKN